MNVSEEAMTVPQFVAIYKVARTSTDEEIAAGRLKTYSVGRRRYISKRAAEEWQRRLERETANEPTYQMFVL